MMRDREGSLVLAAVLAVYGAMSPSVGAETATQPKTARVIDGLQWFPENLTVAYTNRSLYYVPDPVAFRRSATLRDCQRILRGGTLALRKGDGSADTHSFQVILVSSNSAMLSVRGALQQKTVPFVFIDR